METLIDTSKAVPVSGNVLVDKRKMMELVDQLRLTVPEEVRSAEEVLGQNIKILMPSPFKDNHDHYLNNFLSTGVKKAQ